ncbi:MAG: DUF4363 family protein [Sarcina sp.]
MLLEKIFNKSIIAIFIFLAIFSFVVVADNYLKVSFNTVSEKITSIENDLNTLSSNSSSENWNDLYNKSLDLKDFITARYNFLSIYLTHEYLDFLEIETSKLSCYITSKNIGEISATLTSLKLQTHKILQLQKVSIKNIM